MKWAIVAISLVLLGVGLGRAQQSSDSDEGGRILGLEKAWNHALEQKDTRALDMLLANTMVSGQCVATTSPLITAKQSAD
jgi:hypothetical protein